MEHRRHRPDQAGVGGRTDPQTARPFGAGRAITLRAGQMVSGRQADAEERSRMARVFDEGLNKPKGFVLPVQHAGADAPGWMSECWQLRRGHLFLIPGDSPLGLRLPMSSLPHVPPEEYPYVVEQDPMEPRLELAAEDKDAIADGVPATLAQKPKPKPKPVRTAASVEVRAGVLFAF